ncbi:unknown [Clostridium sp. CAG:632]|jgi:hypothetical protein|nr:unknown [Clostridium sp. CAG:632]
MFNFNNKKTKKLVSSIIVAIIVIAMVLGVLVPSLSL